MAKQSIRAELSELKRFDPLTDHHARYNGPGDLTEFNRPDKPDPKPAPKKAEPKPAAKKPAAKKPAAKKNPDGFVAAKDFPYTPKKADDTDLLRKGAEPKFTPLTKPNK